METRHSEAILDTKNLVPAAEAIHKEWLPWLELATREIETMLVSQLASPVTAPVAPLNVTPTVGVAGILRGVMRVGCQPDAVRPHGLENAGRRDREGRPRRLGRARSATW